MRFTARIWLVLAFACAVTALAAPAALGAFGVSKWEAGTCTENTESAPCTEATTSKYYTQAAGHPNFGITDFAFKTNGSGEPEGHVKEVRVDIPTGLSVDPFATPQCKLSELEGAGCPADTQVGEVQLTAHVTFGSLLGTTIGPPLTNAAVYNMEPPPGTPLEAAFKVLPTEITSKQTIVHIVGGIDWSGDYHEFFTIKEIPTSPELIESRLIFFGKALGPGGTLPFITMPSTCLGPQTTFLHVVSYEGQEETTSFTTPVGASGCDKVPFEPSVKVEPATPQSDSPDGATVNVEVPHNPAAPIDSSTLKDARVSLPEGMTLNPSAASGLQACTDEQFGKGTTNEVKCPPGSQIGTDTIETPNLPPGSLAGAVYVGQPRSSDPESGGEYRIFIDAEAPRYGVSVRLEGKVSANAATGRLTTAVLENPQVPFSDFIVTLNGPHLPLANPLVCGPARTNANLIPYSGNPAANPFMAFPVDFDGKGGACPSPLPFTLSQGTAASPTTGGATTSFTFNLARADGQQYLSQISTTLPPGLVGKIPSVMLCGEPQAAQGTCTSASQIGTTTVSVGAGPSPFTLSGPAYLTGPYAGAPYGLSVAVPAEKVGPFNYGTIVTRATINVDPFTARIVVASQLPTIVGGVPLRMRTLTVNTNRPNFMLNPTNCGALETTTTLTSTLGTNQFISSPFQATGCDALAFNPKFSASSNAKTSRANGASLNVKVGYPAGPQANIKSVFVTLPKHLPSRLSTLNHACLQATFNAAPLACPSNSRVGEAVVTTPVLPDKLTGPAIFVSHGGAAFPDLDIVLKGDGVTVILVGNTNITNGITTSNFASVPDVPVSSFELRLPTGPNSALTAIGNICKQSLVMPTTITAQNDKVIKQNTKISVSGCPGVRRSHRLMILSHRVRGHRAIIVVKVPAAGRVSGGGRKLKTIYKHPRKAKKVTLRVPLSDAGVRALRVRHRLAVRVRVGFVPKAKGPRSAAFARVVFK
jgi:hypothetical protein